MAANFTKLIAPIAGLSTILCELAPRIGFLLAAIEIHRSLLYGIIRAPLMFFDITPSGRILARFSKDIDTLDASLPDKIISLVSCAFKVRF